MIFNLLYKIKRKWMKLRVRPIRVYCLHHVTKEFDADSMHQCDWMSIDEFKSKVQKMQRDGVEFISLTDAYMHISQDYFRCRKYAVLTFDDGWASLKNIIPWLCEQQIPVTLFLNPAYIKGYEKREKGVSMGQKELDELLKKGNGYITIASHGWNHALCTELAMQEFAQSVNQSNTYLKQYDAYLPYFAYPCGRHSDKTDAYLCAKGMIPVYMDGKKNYEDGKVIHRELIQ